MAADALVFPPVTLRRPQVRPAGPEWKLLWNVESELRDRYVEIMAGNFPDLVQHKQQLQTSPTPQFWQTIIALLLRAIGPNFGFLRNDYCLLDTTDYATAPLTRVSELTELLDDVPVFSWRLLERIIAFFPLSDRPGYLGIVLQKLRLKMLSILGSRGRLKSDELQTALLNVFEGREEPTDDLALIAEAFRLPGLPVLQLKDTIRRILIDAKSMVDSGIELPPDWDDLEPFLNEAAR